MPNHITNIISFKGEESEIKRLMDSISSEDNPIIDFNKIVPMPQSIKDTPSSSSVDYGVSALLYMTKGETVGLDEILQYPWVKSEGIITHKKLVEFLVKGGQADIETAKVALDNVEKYGHKDWYSWSLENWGTKWNAYDCSVIDNGIVFDTAWSSPIELIRCLSELFPNVVIELEYADEDFGHNCGEVHFKQGVEITMNIPKGGTVEAYTLAAKIKGADEEQMLWYVCDSEDESYIKQMVSMLVGMFGAEILVGALESIDIECFSEIFLSTLKSELIQMEEYEVIKDVDEKIAEFQKVGEN